MHLGYYNWPLNGWVLVFAVAVLIVGTKGVVRNSFSGDLDITGQFTWDEDKKVFDYCSVLVF
jgi:hypothetical protein